MRARRPLPVTEKRFLAPLWLFSLGIVKRRPPRCAVRTLSVLRPGAARVVLGSAGPGVRTLPPDGRAAAARARVPAARRAASPRARVARPAARPRPVGRRGRPADAPPRARKRGPARAGRGWGARARPR